MPRHMGKSAWVLEIQNALNELILKEDPSSTVRSFKFHPLYRVGITCESTGKIELIFGKSFWWRLKNFSGNLKKLDWIKYLFSSFTAPIASDSIIFFRADKQGLIIASHQKKAVLKIFLNKDSIQLLEDEIRTLEQLQNTSFAAHAAKILDHGTTSNGARWLATSFYSNTSSLRNHFFPERYLLKMFPTLIMPPMTDFYKSHEVKTFSIEEWMDSALKRLASHPSQNLLLGLMEVIRYDAKRFPSYKLIESQIHHDLHAGNILVDDTKAIFIDWKGSIRGLVLIDVFDFMRRYLRRHACGFFFFKLFMKDKAPLHKDILPAFEFFREWTNKSFGVNVPVGSERLTILIYILERTLLLFEKRNVDRMKDKRGFEFQTIKIFSSCQKCTSDESSLDHKPLAESLEIP